MGHAELLWVEGRENFCERVAGTELCSFLQLGAEGCRHPERHGLLLMRSAAACKAPQAVTGQGAQGGLELSRSEGCDDLWEGVAGSGLCSLLQGIAVSW